MIYNSDVKQNEILPFATTLIELEDVTVGKTNQRKTNTIWFHLHVEDNKLHKRTNRIINTEYKLVVPRGR